MGVIKHILHLCQNMIRTVFLYLDDALVLANSYSQAKEDGQKVVQLLQRLGFVLSLETCQLESTQIFTHLDLVFKQPQLGQSWKLVTGLTLPQCMDTTPDGCLKRF